MTAAGQWLKKENSAPRRKMGWLIIFGCPGVLNGWPGVPLNILAGIKMGRLIIFGYSGYLLLGGGEYFSDYLPFAFCEGDEPPVSR